MDNFIWTIVVPALAVLIVVSAAMLITESKDHRTDDYYARIIACEQSEHCVLTSQEAWDILQLREAQPQPTKNQGVSL